METKYKAGYIVALQEDGEIVFNLLGEDIGIIELLGLQEYTKQAIQDHIDRSRTTGDYRVHEVGKAVALLNEKIEQLLPKASLPLNSKEETQLVKSLHWKPKIVEGTLKE